MNDNKEWKRCEKCAGVNPPSYYRSEHVDGVCMGCKNHKKEEKKVEKKVEEPDTVVGDVGKTWIDPTVYEYSGTADNFNYSGCSSTAPHGGDTVPTPLNDRVAGLKKEKTTPLSERVLDILEKNEIAALSKNPWLKEKQTMYKDLKEMIEAQHVPQKYVEFYNEMKKIPYNEWVQGHTRNSSWLNDRYIYLDATGTKIKLDSDTGGYNIVNSVEEREGYTESGEHKKFIRLTKRIDLPMDLLKIAANWQPPVDPAIAERRKKLLVAGALVASWVITASLSLGFVLWQLVR